MGIWDLFKSKEQIEIEKQKKQEEEQLKQEALSEVKEEIKQIKKDKIKERLIAEAKGEKKKEEGLNKGLNLLANEFKGAGSMLGTDSQMDKILGKRNTSNNATESNNLMSTDKLMGAIGRSSVLQKDTKGMIVGKGVKVDKNYGELMGGNSGVSNDKLKEMANIKTKSKQK